MFVSESRYNRLEAKYKNLVRVNNENVNGYNKLLEEWNELVEKINSKGGEEFINSPPSKPQFSSDEIKKILVLCHPDKHDGSKLANDITAMLNKIK